MTCPVTRTVDEIRGGLFIDDHGEDFGSTVKIGGDIFVCEDTKFYIISRRMELAWVFVGSPSMAKCAEYYARSFRNIAGRRYSAVYMHIVGERTNIYNYFTRLVDILGELEILITKKIETASIAKQAINISLPNIFLLPNVDQLIIYRPDALEHVANKIIEFINNFNVSSLLKTPIRANILPVSSFTSRLLDSDKKVREINFIGMSDKEAQNALQEIVNEELSIANYAMEVEKYQCVVMNHLNDVIEICEKIMSQL